MLSSISNTRTMKQNIVVTIVSFYCCSPPTNHNWLFISKEAHVFPKSVAWSIQGQADGTDIFVFYQGRERVKEKKLSQKHFLLQIHFKSIFFSRDLKYILSKLCFIRIKPISFFSGIQFKQG